MYHIIAYHRLKEPEMAQSWLASLGHMLMTFLMLCTTHIISF